MQHDTEFYIGWQAEAPPGVARAIRHALLGVALLLPAVAFLIVRFQRDFSTATFEFGTKTVLEGVFRRQPVPFLATAQGNDGDGSALLQNILLVAPGKHGFDYAPGAGALEDGQALRLTGYLIYHDGKTALEVRDIEPLAAPKAGAQPAQTLGRVTLRGEISDPKCMLGVMQPGEGKPHRDCAVRCIAGGIPPILKVANAAGETEYYLLVGPDGQPLNECLLDYVGDGVQVSGQLEQQGDWLVLYTAPAQIFQINKGALNPGPMCN